MSSRSKAEHWAQELEAVAGRIAPQFGRAEPRRRALTYLQGLLAPLERKNGWHLAEAAGDCSPHGMQEFLSRVPWDADALRDDLRAYVVEQLGDADAVLVLDETGFLKKGTDTVGEWVRPPAPRSVTSALVPVAGLRATRQDGRH
jgi:SRSO17 transposase